MSIEHKNIGQAILVALSTEFRDGSSSGHAKQLAGPDSDGVHEHGWAEYHR